jgi:hypothetical protein
MTRVSWCDRMIIDTDTIKWHVYPLVFFICHPAYVLSETVPSRTS